MSVLSTDFRRLLQTLAIIGAGMALTVFLAWLVWAMVWGYAWPVSLRAMQLRNVGWVALGVIGLLLVALSILGRRNFMAKGPGGVSISSTGDEGAAE